MQKILQLSKQRLTTSQRLFATQNLELNKTWEQLAAKELKGKDVK